MPVLPIQFCIDGTKFRELKPLSEKRYAFAPLVPGRLDTYIYHDEKTYMDQYEASYYALTMKKAGWDCFRHYEILAAGCVPYFDNLNLCPSKTMVNFPRKLVKQAMNLPGVTRGKIDFNVFPKEEYEQLRAQLWMHARQHLTCEAMAKYVLLNVPSVETPRILCISGSLYPDYMRCLLVTGLKRVLGHVGCVDFPKIPHLYHTFSGDDNLLYGKGLNYKRVLDDDPDLERSEAIIRDQIKTHHFDLVMYPSLHRGLPLHDLVIDHYKPEEIVYVCGEDLHDTHVCKAITKTGSTLFLREMV